MPPTPRPPRAFRVTVDRPLVGEIDEAARIAAVPDSLTTKGMYFEELIPRLDGADTRAIWPALRAPPRHLRYQAFLDYPFADVLLWMHAVAKKTHPDVSLLEGMRLLGRDTVKVFLASKTGRVVRTLMQGPRGSLLKMPEMWKATDPGNTVTAEAVGESAVRFDVDGFPGWIDCGLLGTLEQIVLNHESEPTLDVELLGPARAIITVHVGPRTSRGSLDSA